MQVQCCGSVVSTRPERYSPPMAVDPRTTPTNVKAPHGARVLEIAWQDGHTSRYPHQLLRGYCPCAGCQGHSGTIAFQDGGNLDLRKLEPVGNYALSLEWGDAHSSGIYSFGYLRLLGDLIEAHGDQLTEVHPELPR